MQERFSLYTNDNLCLCSSTSGLILPEQKNRAQVHIEGDFHIGLQVYIFTIDEFGHPKVLVTRRSSQVDISRSKYDQVAIQMLQEDEQDFNKALIRGLQAELGIYSHEYEALLLDGVELKVVKKYSEDNNLYNREYVKLFFVYLPNLLAKKVSITTPRLQNLLWQSFEKYVSDVQKKPTSFTKTAQFYTFNPDLVEVTNDFISKLLIAKTQSMSVENIQLKTKLLRSEFYQYEDEITIIVSEFYKSMFKKIIILQGSKLLEQIDGVLYHDIYDSKHRKTLTVEAFCQNGQIFEWNRDISAKRDSTFISNIKPLSNARKLLHHKIADSNSKFGNDENFLRMNNILIDHGRALESNYYQLIRRMLNKKQEINSGLDLVCLLGTFDPPHLGHVRVLSDAMIQISQTSFKESIGYLVPIGDRAPGPNGEIWKHGLKNTFDFRYRLCSETVKNFGPIIKTTDIGRKYPTLFGIELCSILA